MFHPAFILIRKQVCCCHDSQDGSAGDGAGDREQLLLWFTTPAYTEGDDPQRQSAAELAELTTGQLTAEQKRSTMAAAERKAKESGKPVFFVHDCGGARDCLSTTSWQGSWPTARRNAEAWASLDPKRIVRVYTEPAGALIAEIKGSDLLSTFVAANTRTEQEQQRLASKTILGKI